MKLFESPDFYDAIVAATAHFQGSGLTEQLIEKDYYVTEVLRTIATLISHSGGIQRWDESIERLEADRLPPVRYTNDFPKTWTCFSTRMLSIPL
jgi:hypothetical protein